MARHSILVCARTVILLGACFVLLAGTSSALASVPTGPATENMTADQYKEYQQMLRIAERKVDRLHALANGSSNALSTSLVTSVLGRYYQVGDHWDVLAWEMSSNMAAMTSDPVTYHYRHKGVFHYEVISVKPGNPSQVTVRITQNVDPKVQWLDLTMTNQFAQDRKVYQFVGHNNYWASPNGVHTNVSSLELFPLDVPDIYTAERSVPTQLPELPPEIQGAAQKAGYSANLSQSSWFDQQDIFGRPIQILWQRGDLWPTYMKTSTGIAILVRSGS